MSPEGNLHLVVIAPFGRFERGDEIADADEIAYAEREHFTHVVRVGEPVEPAPAAPEPATGATE